MDEGKRGSFVHKLIKILLCVTLISTLVFAAGAPEAMATGETKSGSIRLNLRQAESVPKEGTVMFQRVAEPVTDQEKKKVIFRLTEDYRDSNLNPNESPSKELAEGFLAYTRKEQITGFERAVENGSVYCPIPKGEEGLYLCYQMKPTEEGLVMMPILVSVPQRNSTGLSYNVSADPKMGLPEENPENPDNPVEPIPPDEDGDEPERVPGEDDDLGGDGTEEGFVDGTGGDGLDQDGNGGRLPQTGGPEGTAWFLFVLGSILCFFGMRYRKRLCKNGERSPF